jgi:hypothetical protein
MDKQVPAVIRRLTESREMIDRLLEMAFAGGDVSQAFWLAVDSEVIYRCNSELYSLLHQALREVEIAGGDYTQYL